MNMYKLLSRMESDCKYFFKTSAHTKHLWAGSVEDQITKMKKIWNDMEEKPEWLSFEQIEEYEVKMIEAVKNGQVRLY